MNYYEQARAPDAFPEQELLMSLESENSCDIGLMYEDTDNPDI